MGAPATADGRDRLEGVVDRITYQSPETGYTVVRLGLANGTSAIAVGHLPGLRPGEALTVDGQWVLHPRHGRQFQVTSVSRSQPATVQGVERYLGSGLIKGVGPVVARRIVERFGLETLRLIDEEPARLLEVPGIGPTALRRITKAWQAQRSIQTVMVALQSLGVSTAHAARLFSAYGDEAAQIVRTEPYRLAGEVHGIGFVTADTIARGAGLRLDSPARVAASLRYVLSLAADREGHVCLPRETLLQRACDLLQRDAPAADWATLAAEAVDRLVHEEGLWLESNADGEALLYLAPFRHAEVGAANRIISLARARDDRLPLFQRVDFEAAFAWLAKQGEPALSTEQQAAVHCGLRERVSVLTGGPGTGKTTCLRAVVRLALAKRARVLLLAPTGRAAKRLAELTGAPASTIHRQLRLRPGGGAEFDETNPLEADLVVVDEASMLDVILANTLFKAIPPGAHLLLVGDVDQLPSVGPGSVLADVIRSRLVPVTRLTTVFRQAEESLIIQNAYRVQQGRLPLYGRAGRETAAREDFFMIEAADDVAAAGTVVDLVVRRLPRRYGFQRGEVQVLAAMHKGQAGVARLNELLQAALNPPVPGRAELRLGGMAVRVGDRVMATRNDYDRQVFNGDLGQVDAVNGQQGELTVRLDDGRHVRFDTADLADLELAYALSIHKSQGSEFRAVVMPVLTSQYVMLARNLLYTGLTRARELVVVVGQARALAMAVGNDRVTRRYGRLAERLGVAVPGS